MPIATSRPQDGSRAARAAAAAAAETHGADNRWRQVDVRIRRLGARPDGLIEVLHTVQELFGYLDDDALAYVSGALGVPPSQVMAVATFYSHFMLKPQGEHTCVVCMGTACYINGAGALLQKIQDEFGVGPGATTADGKLSVLRARCLGACAMAPAAVVDGEVHGKITPAELAGILEHQ
jgi:bidirectional [NiFe] hydrogenase diaphorase subunit